MIDETKGFRSFQAILKVQKSLGWAAHNEFDYFKLCPACGHWFDCRTPESLMKHKCATAAGIVVKTIVRTSIEKISPAKVATETPDPIPTMPASRAKS